MAGTRRISEAVASKVTFSEPVEVTATFEEFKQNYAWNVIATGPLDTGADHDAGASSTRNGCGRDEEDH